MNRNSAGASLRAAVASQMMRDSSTRATDAGAARPSVKPGFVRRVLPLSLEGTFSVDNDPSLLAFHRALVVRGHVVLPPMRWCNFILCGASARALTNVDMVLVLASSYNAGEDSPFVTRLDEAGASLRDWVARGGSFVVVAAEDRHNSFSRLFDKKWSYSDYFRTTHALNAASEQASIFALSAPEAFSVKSLLLSDVPVHEAVYMPAENAQHESLSMILGGAGELSSMDPGPGCVCVTLACGSFGAGRVASIGDVNWEPSTLLAIAALADAARSRGEAPAEDPSAPAPCFLCGASSSFSCGRCRSRRYCGVPCQKRDWPSHRATCHSPVGPAQLGQWIKCGYATSLR